MALRSGIRKKPFTDLGSWIQGSSTLQSSHAGRFENRRRPHPAIMSVYRTRIPASPVADMLVLLHKKLRILRGF
jgi:hypothetical protein